MKELIDSRNEKVQGLHDFTHGWIRGSNNIYRTLSPPALPLLSFGLVLFRNRQIWPQAVSSFYSTRFTSDFFFFFGRASLRYIKWFTHLKFTHLKFTHLYKPIVFGYIQRVIQPSSQTVWNIFITSKQNPMSFRSHSPFSHTSYPPVPDNHQSTFCFYCFDYHGHVI